MCHRAAAKVPVGASPPLTLTDHPPLVPRASRDVLDLCARREAHGGEHVLLPNELPYVMRHLQRLLHPAVSGAVADSALVALYVFVRVCHPAKTPGGDGCHSRDQREDHDSCLR